MVLHELSHLEIMLQVEENQKKKETKRKENGGKRATRGIEMADLQKWGERQFEMV